MDPQKPEARHYANGLETNLMPIAQHIFGAEPKLPYSIGLQLDHPLDSDITYEDFLHEMLQLLLLIGVSIKFGPEATFKDLNSNDLQLLRRYMWSVGYDPILHLDTQSETFTLEFKPYRVGQ